MKTVHTVHPLLEVDPGPGGGVQQLNVLNSVETALIVLLLVGEGHNSTINSGFKLFHKQYLTLMS